MPAKNWKKKSVIITGFEEKQVQIGKVLFNYAEGKNNGSPLVLLHAQLMDWYSYHKVMPALAEKYHVFAVDYPGHGKTAFPEEYEMSAEQIGSDIAAFIEKVIGEAVYISGNSSGGLLAVWLAANRPDLIRAAVLEDPPLFSAEYPTVCKTVAYKSFTTSKRAVQDGYDEDFLLYWVENSTNFFKNHTFPGAQSLLSRSIKSFRKKNPGQPFHLPLLSGTVGLMMRGLDYYNPLFGAAFYDGSWNKNFEHATALAKITCPVVLIHADYSFDSEEVLIGAMSQEMADTAVSLLHDCKYIRIHSGHVVHLENPDTFIKILVSCFDF